MVLGLALLGSVEREIKETDVFGDYRLMLLYYFCFWGLGHIFFCSTGFKLGRVPWSLFPWRSNHRARLRFWG